MKLATKDQIRVNAECEYCGKMGDLKHVGSDKLGGWQCGPCRELEATLAATVAAKTAQNPVVATMQANDATIKTQDDILTAINVQLIEAKAAINADLSIPEQDKGYAFVNVVALHVQTLKAAQTAHRKAMEEIEAGLRVWQVNGQTEYPKLRLEHQAKFAEMFNVSLAPVVKPAKPRSGKKPLIPSKPIPGTKSASPTKSGRAPRFNMIELAELSEKYGVPTSAIQLRAQSKGCTMEEAAKALAVLNDM